MNIVNLSDDGSVTLNLQRLVTSRMLLQANSGGGKSWALRRILEQSHGDVQQIVIDVEDEFYTLREKFDYILVRKEGGDCVPEVRSAALLAHRLLELGVSAIVSIYEMKSHERIAFVKAFLDAMVNAPKKLWHPALIVVDEAHVFCPEKEQAESAGSVIDLMTRGRKRGFCGILATQRISKLAKDAAAEANNKLIGRAALDVDMKRAGDEIGFVSKEDRLSLRQLKAGEFFAFGPAISDTVIPVKVGGVETTHPKAGSGLTPVAPPKHKVQRVLAQLADLPQQAEEQHATVASLKTQVRELKTKLTQAEKAQPAAPAPPKIDKTQMVRANEVAKAKRALEEAMKFIIEITTKNFDAGVPADEIHKAISGAVDTAMKRVESIIASRFDDVSKLKKDAQRVLYQMKQVIKMEVPVRVEVRRNEPFSITPPKPRVLPRSQSANNESAVIVDGELKISATQQRILDALAWFESIGNSSPTTLQVGAVALIDATGGHFSNTVGPLSSHGLVVRGAGSINLTDKGRQFAQIPESVSTLADYHDVLRQRIRRAKSAGGKTVDMLNVIINRGGADLTAEEIGREVEIDHTGGHFSNTIGPLGTLGLIRRSHGVISPTDIIFPPGLT